MKIKHGDSVTDFNSDWIKENIANEAEFLKEFEGSEHIFETKKDADGKPKDGETEKRITKLKETYAAIVGGKPGAKIKEESKEAKPAPLQFPAEQAPVQPDVTAAASKAAK